MPLAFIRHGILTYLNLFCKCFFWKVEKRTNKPPQQPVEAVILLYSWDSVSCFLEIYINSSYGELQPFAWNDHSLSLYINGSPSGFGEIRAADQLVHGTHSFQSIAVRYPNCTTESVLSVSGFGFVFVLLLLCLCQHHTGIWGSCKFADWTKTKRNVLLPL